MNNYEQLGWFLNQIHPINEDVLNEYTSKWEEVECTRQEILVKEGETEEYMYFVLKGIQCSFFYKAQKKHVIHLTYSPALIALPESFLLQQPSSYSLECITNSKLLKISYSNHQSIMDKYPEIERLIRKALELIVVELIKRHHELVAYSIKERFSSFMKNKGKLINKVPHKYLASYLNIDPSNFSRLLNNYRI